MTKTVGILALQGDFEAHGAAIERAGGTAVYVRTAEELDRCDGLVIPGGESTTMLKLLNEMNLFEAVRTFGRHRPIYGTCAGAILMAKSVSSPQQASLNLMDIDVQRNAYGRQIDSRIVKLPSDRGEIEAVFIRAPIIRRAGTNVRIRAAYGEDPVWAEDGLHMVTTFHPELTQDCGVHRAFLDRL